MSGRLGIRPWNKNSLLLETLLGSSLLLPLIQRFHINLELSYTKRLFTAPVASDFSPVRTLHHINIKLNNERRGSLHHLNNNSPKRLLNESTIILLEKVYAAAQFRAHSHEVSRVLAGDSRKQPNSQPRRRGAD